MRLFKFIGSLTTVELIALPFLYAISIYFYLSNGSKEVYSSYVFIMSAYLMAMMTALATLQIIRILRELINRKARVQES